jgi:hypothetical protein
MFHVHVDTPASVPSPSSEVDAGLLSSLPKQLPTALPPSAGAPDDCPRELSFSVGSLHVEVIYGSIHLFRQQGQPPSQAGSSRTLAVIAVPSHISFSDFVLFVGPYSSAIEHMRILRDAVKAIGRFMVLIRFSSQAAADGFYAGFNAKPFSSFDTEVAHIVYVSHVKLASSLRTAETALTAGCPDDPRSSEGTTDESCCDTATPCARLQMLPTDPLNHRHEDGTETDPCAPVGEAALASAVTSDMLAPGDRIRASKDALVELPTCPVCLERLEPSVSGMLTTVCNHTFHCSCLSRWQDDTCPVCRYCFADELMEAEETTAFCEACGAKDNLWMCLVCGHIGCGRYSREHAVAHFRITGHTYSIELSTQRVWDYAGDGYVHRLIQNKTDGKLVEVPDMHASSEERSRVPRDTAEYQQHCISVQKADAIAFEYTVLLTSQLEVQRQYYETMLAELASLVPDDKLGAVQAIIWQHAPRSPTLSASTTKLSPPDVLGHMGEAGFSVDTPSSHTHRPRGHSLQAPPAGAAVYRATLNAIPEELTRSKMEEFHARSLRLQEALEGAEREKKTLMKQCEELGLKAMRQAEEIAFLRDVNDTLSRNQQGWEDKCKAAEAATRTIAQDAERRVVELEEQVKDLMFFLDTQRKFEDAPASMKRDLDSGHVLITTESSDGGHRSRARAAPKKPAGPASSPLLTGPSNNKAEEIPEEMPSIAVAQGKKRGSRKR